MQVRLVTKWHGAAFEAKVRAGLGRNLAAAATHLKEAIVVDITKSQGTGSPPTRSRPGDPPYRQTGALARSYFAFTDRKALVAQVGSPLDYSRYLELGRLNMAPRPHIRDNLYGNSLIPYALCQPII